MELGRNAKRFISALLAFVMVLSWVPGSALTARASEAGLCEHHTAHTAECGYRAASPGAACKYDGLCDKGCADSDGDGWIDHAQDCADTREMEKDLCDQGCTDLDGDGFADHGETCAYAQSRGQHTHDGSCGYAEAVEGSACVYQCEPCAALTVAPLSENPPEETTAQTTVPVETTVETTAPVQTTAETTVPVETTAETTVPETTAETVPETTAETVPETTAATVPEETLSPAQQIQELIDALPEHVTEDNRDAVTAQLQEILSLFTALTEAEQEQIDITPCILLQQELAGQSVQTLEGVRAAEPTGNCTGDHTGWTEWTSDKELPTTPGMYYLTKDVRVWIGEGKKYWDTPVGETTICLNGHHITKNSTTSSGDARNSFLIAVTNDGTLNLHDCQGGGYVERPGSSYGAICVFPDAVFNMYGGSIRNSGIGVYIDHEDASTYGRAKSGRFNMYGGTISGCGTASVYVNSLLRPGGGFYMYGGTLNSRVSIYNLTGNYSSGNFNTLHYFGGTINSDPQVFISNNKSIYVGAPLSEPLRLKVNEDAGFRVPDGKLVVAEPDYTLTEADALQVISPSGTKIPVVDPLSNSIVLKEVTSLSSNALTLDAINYGQQAKEAAIHGSVTVDGTTPLAGRFWIDDETVYDAGTHEVTVKFQPENRSEELTYTVPLTVNKVAPTLAWAADKLTQEVAKPQIDTKFAPPETNSDGTVSYAYRAVDTAAWTDGLPTECGTYEVKAKLEESTNYYAAKSTNTVTLTVVDGPGAPAITGVNLSDGKAEVTWDAPGYVGSSEITGYEVTWLKDGVEVKKETLGADVRSAAFTLTDESQGGEYTCVVAAKNDTAGLGAEAKKEQICISMKPVITQVKFGEVQVQKQYYAEGETLDTSDFTVWLTYNYGYDGWQKATMEQLDDLGAWFTLRSMNPGSTVKKDIDYKTYRLTLEDYNSELRLNVPTGLPGQSVMVHPANIYVDKAYPGPPQNLKVKPGDHKLIVTWEEPAITYGKETIGYTIVCKDASGKEIAKQEVGGATHELTLTGLTNDELYTIEVWAENENGLGKTPAAADAKPSPYPTIIITACPKIIFGHEIPTKPQDGETTADGQIIRDFTNLTDLTVEFASEVQSMAEGYGFLVTFETKTVGTSFSINQKFRVTPVVQVVDADGKVVTDHPYTIVTPTSEIPYTEWDISDGGRINPSLVSQYRGFEFVPGGYMLELNGTSFFIYPSNERINSNYYDYMIYDQAGNPVNGFFDAGDYKVVLTGKNGCTGTIETTLTLGRLEVEFFAGRQTVTYGQAIALGADGVLNHNLERKDSLKEITLTPSTTHVTTEGTITLSDAVIWNSEKDRDVTSNYTITYLPVKLTITKAEHPTIDFRESSITLEYNNGAPIAPPTEDMLTFTGAYYEDILFEWQDADGNVLASAPTEMGSYKLRAYLVDNADHGAAEDTAVVKVGAKRLSEANMTLAEGSFVYSGSEYEPAVTVKDGENVIDSSKYTVTYEENTDAGTAAVTVADNDDTDIYEISGTLTFTIDPCPLDGLEASVENPDSIVYDGTEQTPGVTVTGPNGTALTADTDYTVTYTNSLNAGAATVTINAVANGNYSGTKELAFTVAPKPVTPVLSGTASKVYDGTAAAPAGSLTVTLQGVLEVDADKLTVSAKTMTYNSANVAEAGTITATGLTLSGAASGNYALSAAEISIPGKITKRAPEITFADQAITFGETPTAAATDSNGTFTYSYENQGSTEDTDDGWPADAGTYNVTATVAETDNYLSGSASISLTISPKDVTNPTIILSQESFEYDGTEKKPTVTLKDGDQVIPADEYTVTYSGNTHVGAATVTITDNADGNYTVNGSATFQITKRLLSGENTAVSVNPQSYVYDGTEKEPEVTVTYKGIEVPAEEYVVSYQNNVNAGTATVTVAAAGGDYDGERSATFTITPKPITVTITPNGGVYGGAIQAAAAKLDESALVPGDAAPTVTLTYTGKANDGMEVNSTTPPTLTGTYTVTASIPEGNYILAGKTTEAFVIDRAESGLTVEAVTAKTYGDGDFDLTVTQTGDGRLTYASNKASVVTVDETGKVHIVGAGTAKITVTVAETDNYKGAAVDVTVTVAKKPVKVTVDSKTKAYGEPDPELTYTVEKDALVGTDILKMELTVSGKDIGTYDITAPNAVKDNPNYEITFEKGQLTINPRTIDDAEIVLGPALTANGSEQTQQIQSVTVKNSKGEVLNVTYNVAGNTGINAGGYEMTITGTGNFTGTKKQSFAIAPGGGQPVDTDSSGNPVLGDGKIIEEIHRESGAPATSLGTPKAEILEMLTESGDVTAQELAAVADGVELKIIFPVRDGVSADDQAKIKALARGYTVGCYFDITMYKQLGDGEKTYLHETSKPITMTVQVPDSLLNTQKNVKRTFWIIRCHDGEAEFLPTRYNDSNKTLSFETDHFSGYAIVYKDTKTSGNAQNTATNDIPRTGDNSHIELWITVMALSAVGIGAVMTVKRKKRK